MVGDTPDDIVSAVAAGCVGIGVLTPEEHAKNVLKVSEADIGMEAPMREAGAVEVQVPGLAGLLEWFPAPAVAGAGATTSTSGGRIGKVARATKETSISCEVCSESQKESMTPSLIWP